MAKEKCRKQAEADIEFPQEAHEMWIDKFGPV